MKIKYLYTFVKVQLMCEQGANMQMENTFWQKIMLDALLKNVIYVQISMYHRQLPIENKTNVISVQLGKYFESD